LWWYIVVSSTKFTLSHHQDNWITKQYAFVNQQFALQEKNTELLDIKLCSVESHFHLDSCSVEHNARVWRSETPRRIQNGYTTQCANKWLNVWYCVLQRHRKINSANSPASVASVGWCHKSRQHAKSCWRTSVCFCGQSGEGASILPLTW
jgi:hypothetical protein